MRNQSRNPDPLNRLLAIHYRSLPMYLVWATPYRREEDDRAWKTIQQVVDDQKAASARIVELILERHWPVDYGDFPITFTSSHDLALGYLLRRLIEWQKGTVAAIQEVGQALSEDSVALGLADECLGSAKAHWEMLDELIAPPHATVDVKLHDPAA